MNSNFFIHTFSIKITVSQNEGLNILRKFKYYGNRKSTGNSELTDHSEKKTYEINSLGKQGIRMIVRKRDPDAIRYDPQKLEDELIIIVNPFELLNNSRVYGHLCSEEEYIEALRKLNIFLEQEIGPIIESGNNLRNWSINRVDITRDIVTPNDTYTLAILSAIKLIRLPKGYNVYTEIKEGWDPKQSYLYYNHNQEIKVKFYNKSLNLKNNGYSPEEYGIDGGLLRIEVSLSSQYFRNNNCSPYNVVDCIIYALDYSQSIYDKYICLKDHNIPACLAACTFFSKPVLLRYIKYKYPTKYNRQNKMHALINALEKCKDNPTATNKFLNSQFKQNRPVILKFISLGVSPIPLSENTPYIPSLFDLIYDFRDDKHYKFAKKRTLKKEVWNYGTEQ